MDAEGKRILPVTGLEQRPLSPYPVVISTACNVIESKYEECRLLGCGAEWVL
jgi:hypothetical protein